MEERRKAPEAMKKDILRCDVGPNGGKLKTPADYALMAAWVKNRTKQREEHLRERMQKKGATDKPTE